MKLTTKHYNIISYFVTAQVIVLLLLKLFGILDINWLWVFSPFIAVVFLFFAVLIIGVIVGSIAYFIRKWKNKK